MDEFKVLFGVVGVWIFLDVVKIEGVIIFIILIFVCEDGIFLGGNIWWILVNDFLFFVRMVFYWFLDVV